MVILLLVTTGNPAWSPRLSHTHIYLEIPMFLDNKYTKWYIKLISSAQSKPLLADSYYEVHHIIPRCMGGTDDSENLVSLTGKGHYIAHLLLTKMTVGIYHRKMTFALWKMTSSNTNQQRHQVTSSQYQSIKEKMAHAIKEQNKGRIIPEHVREKIKDAIANRSGPWNKGLKMPPEFGKAVSKRRTGTKCSAATRTKISEGVKKSNKCRQNTSKSLKGRSIPRYTTVLQHKVTKEIYYVTLLKDWLVEQQLCARKFRKGRTDYVVIDRFVTSKGPPLA